MTKKRYVQVGTGSRARFFYEAIATDFKETCEMVGFCDYSQTRMDFANVLLARHGSKKVPTYLHTAFAQMLDDLKPDYVIVTTTDRDHHTYIIKAMEKGYDVICEKPMTIDAEKAQQIIDCQKRTGKSLRVTFNYRYSPHNSKIRELIRDGAIGDVFSVQLEWLLNVKHGADYYRRWHRNKENSGGLLVHKATHHFDLVNFWLDAKPKTVFAFGDLNFYGQANALARGVEKFYYRCLDNEHAKDDPFAIDLRSNEELQEMYLNAEDESGYIRDRSVFSDGISIEDTMAVTVKYDTGAILTYSLNSYLPWEGFNLTINGSKGRIEMKIEESSYISAGGSKDDEGAVLVREIKVYPLFGTPYDVDVVESEGGHGGGDPRLLLDVFGKPEHDELNRAASHLDGTMSILTGVAANKSIASGMPVNIKDLIEL